METFRIIELNVLRGFPGRTLMEKYDATSPREAMENFYKNNPGAWAGSDILVIPESCVSEFHKNIKPRVVPRNEGIDK